MSAFKSFYVLSVLISHVSSQSACLSNVTSCGGGPSIGPSNSAVNGSWIQTVDIASCLSTTNEIYIDSLTVAYEYTLNGSHDLNVTLRLTLFVPDQLYHLVADDGKKRLTTKQETYQFNQAGGTIAITFTDLGAQIGCNDKFASTGTLGIWVQFVGCSSYCDLTSEFSSIVPQVCTPQTLPTPESLFRWNEDSTGQSEHFILHLLDVLAPSDETKSQRMNVDLTYSDGLDCRCDLKSDIDSGDCHFGEISLSQGNAITQIFDTSCFDSQPLTAISIQIGYSAQQQRTPPVETFTLTIRHDSDVIAVMIIDDWEGSFNSDIDLGPPALLNDTLVFELNNNAFIGGCGGSSTYEWTLQCTACGESNYYWNMDPVDGFIGILACEYGVDFRSSGITLTGTIDPVTYDYVHPAFELHTNASFYCPELGPNCTYNCPTQQPTKQPTSVPTTNPSKYPTKHPTKYPSLTPSDNPSTVPTLAPTFDPSTPPTSPTQIPTINPTQSTSNPSLPPTLYPSGYPSIPPTVVPTNNPTDNPSVNPTLNPTLAPTVNPSIDPSLDPTKTPSMNPSYNPTLVPTRDPSTTYNPTLYPTVPTIAVDDICSEWSISITFTIQTKNTMNGPQLETVLNANCANAFTKTIRRNVTQWNNDWCIAIDITVRIAARRRRQLLQQSSNDFTVDAQFMMNDILFTDVFMDYDANAFGDTFEKEFAESLSRNGVISNGGVSALTISDAIDISSSTTDKGTFFVDFGDGITVVLFTLISATILTVIIGKINSKLFSGPDDFRWAFVFVFGVYSWDIVSDWLFAVSLYNGYIARSSGSDYVVYVILFIASLFFIMMPIASNFRCLYVFQSRWQRNPLHGERYKAWFEEYGTAVYALSLICGSTFGAIQVVNSNLAQFRFFTMGLTLFELNEFRQARIVNVVLIENVPQLLIQCIFSVQSNGLSTISILAIMSSVVSICVSFLDHISKRQLLTDEKVSYSLFAFNVYCIGMSEFANKYKFKTKQLGLEIAKMFKALDKKAIQVLPSQLISHERHGDGLIISFQVATASIKPQQLFDELMAAAAKPSVNDDVLSLLARQILKSWKLEVSNDFDLVIDNMQWITEQQVLDKQKTIQLQMSTMLQAQETQD
eukprot:491400_1